MKKRSDGRTVKGLRIRGQVRERILTAYIELLRGGGPSPTARATAARAELSLRVIFKHFSDLRALRLPAFKPIPGPNPEMPSHENSVRAATAARLELILPRH